MRRANENRPRKAAGAVSRSVVATHHQDTAGTSTAHLIPAPVDLNAIPLLVMGPMPTEDSPFHPHSDWNLYDRPPAPPWGSYLDTTPLPKHPDGRGPITVMHDMIARHQAEVTA